MPFLFKLNYVKCFVLNIAGCKGKDDWLKTYAEGVDGLRKIW